MMVLTKIPSSNLSITWIRLFPNHNQHFHTRHQTIFPPSSPPLLSATTMGSPPITLSMKIYWLSLSTTRPSRRQSEITVTTPTWMTYTITCSRRVIRFVELLLHKCIHSIHPLLSFPPWCQTLSFCRQCYWCHILDQNIHHGHQLYWANSICSFTQKHPLSSIFTISNRGTQWQFLRNGWNRPEPEHKIVVYY